MRLERVERVLGNVDEGEGHRPVRGDTHRESVGEEDLRLGSSTSSAAGRVDGAGNETGIAQPVGVTKVGEPLGFRQEVVDVRLGENEVEGRDADGNRAVALRGLAIGRVLAAEESVERFPVDVVPVGSLPSPPEVGAWNMPVAKELLAQSLVLAPTGRVRERPVLRPDEVAAEGGHDPEEARFSLRVAPDPPGFLDLLLGDPHGQKERSSSASDRIGARGALPLGEPPVRFTLIRGDPTEKHSKPAACFASIWDAL